MAVTLDQQVFSCGKMTRARRLGKSMARSWDLYLLSLSPLILLLVFKYLPMYGAVIAFKDFNIRKGILGSDWIGLAHFQRLFATPDFVRVLRNTFIISLQKLLFQFPTPLIFALLLNEVRAVKLKRTVQTISYIPHFMSWVVVAGVFIHLLSPSRGIVNEIITAFGGEPVYFLSDNRWFRTVLVGSMIWKDLGWSTIIYMAAIAGIDPELYQAALVDGAGRFRQILHITIPSIVPTIIVLVIIRMGKMADAGMDQVLMLYNPSVYETGDIIDTYVYRIAFERFELGFTAAAGLFKSVIGATLLFTTDRIAKGLGYQGVY